MMSMNHRSDWSQNPWLFIGLPMSGAVLAWFIPSASLWFNPLLKIYVDLLNLFVVPLILLAIVFLSYLGTSIYSRQQRTSSGQQNKPLGILIFRSAVILVVGAGFVSFLNVERGANPAVTSLRGVPYVVPIVLILLAVGTFVLNRTKFGRHVYAVGGNAEAARRAGIQVSRVRITVFMISSTFAGIAGILMASRQASVDAAAGRSIVLNAIAAAVVGGVSLFGGRGRLSDAVIGGFVIAVIDNGLGLIGLASGLNLAITGGVLLLAATADAITSRKSRTS